MKKFLKNKWFKRIVILTVIVALIAGGTTIMNKTKKSTETEKKVSTAVVTRRNIENTVTGSGTVEAYETYNIVPTVTGEIVFCEAEEGQWVEEDQILYKFDTEKSDNAISKAQNSVENAALSLESAQDNVDNLTIVAPAQGVVSGLGLIIGDKANGTVCTLTDNTYMIAEIPVSSSSVGKISRGDEVTVGLEKYMTTMEGYVDRISSARVAGSNGAMVTNVDIIIENPGSVLEGTYCSATFHTKEGDIDGAEAGVLNYPDSAKANAEQSGTVTKINVKNGDWVNKGDVIAVLENTAVTNQLKTAKMNYSDAVSNLADTKKEAEDYVLTAPISGKIMQKNYKKGDTVAGNNSTTLMVIADTTKMKFTMNIDELDVAKITVGQEVTLEADAIEGEVFKGKIETISLIGTSSSGVTYYPVNVVIDNPGALIPGMNVSAEVIVESAVNAIAVPSGAVSYYDGKYYVTVMGEVEGMEDFPSRMEKMEGKGFPGGEMGEGFEKPTGDRRGTMEMPTGDMKMPGEMPAGEMKMNRGENNGQMQGNRGDRNMAQSAEMKENMYAEEVRVEVKTGVSDDDYTEIISGVSVGMIVAVTGSDNANSPWGQMQGMGGRMNGGRMPMGGGMPMGSRR